MQSISINLILSWLILGPWCAVTSADGGRVVLMERQGNYRITVLTAPDPLRAGPIDISVLLQEAETGKPVTNARINVSLTPGGGRGRTVRAVATNDAATIKLLSAALVELPERGAWDVEIACLAEQGPARVRFRIDAGPRSPRWLNEWPWFSWPVAVIMLFGIHRRPVARRRQQPRNSAPT
jgi:hypothetical protein